MRLVVDTGVFSAFVSRRRRAQFEPLLAKLSGSQLFLAGQTVAELRYGALVAGWVELRRSRLEAAIAATTVVPITDSLELPRLGGHGVVVVHLTRAAA
ncbi:MAG: hypothetical protein JWM47_2958 [Acidimicrobiales bacterium]|nr:hypothetical protein [Acidimicrobiales bacterium]